MLDTTKQTFRWRLLLFFPSFVTMVIFSIRIELLEKLVWLLLVINAVCSFLAASQAVTASNNRVLHLLKVVVLGSLLFVLNLIVGYFGGCTCAGATDALRK